MKTKEDLLNRIRKIDEYNEYNAIRGFEWVGHKNESTRPDVLLLSNFEESDNMCNFALEFAALLKKYRTKIHEVNGMLVSFEFPDAPEKYLGVCPFWRWFQFTDEEMDAKIKEVKVEAEQIVKEKTLYESRKSENTEIINNIKEIGIDDIVNNRELSGLIIFLKSFNDANELKQYCLNAEIPENVIKIKEMQDKDEYKLILSDINYIQKFANILDEEYGISKEEFKDIIGSEDCDYDEDCGEEDEEYEMYDYDACGSFIADIEINVGKIELNENTIDDELMQECWDKLLDMLGSDSVEVENDDEVFETLKFKILEDGTTLVKAKGAKCSVRVDIQASCLDEANDERWSAFDSIVRSLNYLNNIRNEHVSEAD